MRVYLFPAFSTVSISTASNLWAAAVPAEDPWCVVQSFDTKCESTL